MPLWAALAVSGLVCIGIGRLALYQLIPKLKARERRSQLSASVPDPQDSQLAGARLFWLIWTLKTSHEGPRFRSHVWLVRWLAVIGFGLLVASPFVMQGEARMSAANALERPAPVTVLVGG